MGNGKLENGEIGKWEIGNGELEVETWEVEQFRNGEMEERRHGGKEKFLNEKIGKEDIGAWRNRETNHQKQNRKIAN